MSTRLALIAPLMAISCVSLAAGARTCTNNVAGLDNEFQAATKRNDVATIDRLLPSDYILVTDIGKVETKADLLNEARGKKYTYWHQEDRHQTVRIWGDTAVLTALLWVEGTTAGRHFNLRVWFSDTYACTPQGWRYVLGQVGTPIRIK